MSGTMPFRLAESRHGALRPLLPQERDLAAWHAALTSEIGTQLGPHHAAILAQPVATADGWAWQASGAAMRRLDDLPADSRRALVAAGSSIFSDIRRLAESGSAPTVAAAWPALREVPGPSSIFAIDGRPVLSAWGHATSDGAHGIFAAQDDGIAWVAPPRQPWNVYAVALACVALLALAAGLLLPAAAPWMPPAPTVCRATPGQLEAIRLQSQVIDRGEDLKRLLATVNDDIGRKQLQCPLPVAAPLPAPLPAPRPAVRPPHAELPQDLWNRHDLSMLNGCWHNVTRMVTTDGARRQLDVQEWQICFNASGAGEQTLRWSDGGTCRGATAAAFSAEDRLLLTDAEKCHGTNRYLYRGRMTCTRLNDTEATCIRNDTEGPGISAPGQAGRFIR